LNKEILHFSAHARQALRPSQIDQSAILQPSSAPTCIVRRLQDVPISFVEVMPASDFRCVRILQTAPGEARVEWELFSEFLEKGVIRKARIQCAFVPREDDLDAAASICRQIDQSELPLTT
jgi:hypothetical protein